MTRQHRWSTAVLFALAAVGYPIIAAFPIIFGLSSRVTSVPYRVAFLGLATLVLIQNLKRKRFYAGRVWIPLGLFWLLYSLRLVTDTIFFPIELSIPATEYFTFAYGVCFIPMLAFLGCPDDETLDLAFKVSLVAAAIACVLSLYASYIALLTGRSTTFSNGRLGTETLQTIGFGYMGAITALLAIFGRGRWRNPLVRLVLAGMLAAALFIMSAAASRGPILGLALVVVAVVGIWARHKPAHYGISLIAGVFLLGVLFLGALSLLEDRLGFRGASRLFDTGDTSTQQHVEMGAGAWEEFLDNPLTGSAIHETQSRDYPHNVLVESFMATGILGGVAFCVTFMLFGLTALRLLQYRSTQWVAMLALLQVFAAATSGALYLSDGMWSFGAAAIALGHMKRRENALRATPAAAHLSLAGGVPAQSL